MTQMGSILRGARESKGLTQESLAEQIGVSTRTIIAIEKNQRNPTCDVLYRLIRALNISADLILNTGLALFTAEQDQYIREFLSYNEREQRIVISTSRNIIKTLRQDGSENKSEH
jgi:transcriptional regulator with XRE-family HTH domain